MAEIHNAEITCLVESHLNCDIFDNKIKMDKFNIHRCDRSDRSHGGVIMYISKKYNSISVTQTSNRQCELVGVLVKEMKSLIFTV